MIIKQYSMCTVGKTAINKKIVDKESMPMYDYCNHSVPSTSCCFTCDLIKSTGYVWPFILDTCYYWLYGLTMINIHYNINAKFFQDSILLTKAKNYGMTISIYSLVCRYFNIIYSFRHKSFVDKNLNHRLRININT